MSEPGYIYFLYLSFAKTSLKPSARLDGAAESDPDDCAGDRGGRIPLSLGKGEPGKGIQQSMAVVTFGGIVISTVLNIVVLSALYLKFANARARVESDFPSAVARATV